MKSSAMKLRDDRGRSRLVYIAIVTGACSSHQLAKEPGTAPLRHEVSCPGVKAIWSGESTGTYEHYTQLTLEVAGATKPWTLDLENISRSAWSFDIFSPDCRRVLLLQSRLGPFHIVRVDHLARYIRDGQPDFELVGERVPDATSGTGNFRNGSWVSNTEVTYEWGCCDPPVTSRFVIPPIPP
jgi:hypothetical protein